MSRFGEKMRTLRKRRGMTLAQLAHAMGYTSASYMSEIETGKQKPTIEFAVKVSRVFQVSMDLLTKDERELDEPDEEAG
jgi:transcriptional regulator with XRE-family HTH domain